MVKLTNIELIFDNNVCSDISQLCESDYLFDIMTELQKHWKGKLGIKSSNYAHPPNSVIVNGGVNDVLIYLSEDFRDVPVDLIKGYRVVFKCYNTTSERFIPFPLGCEKEVYPLINSANWEDRTKDVFFSGALNNNRVRIYRQVMNLSWISPDLILRLSRSRFKGLLPLDKTLSHFDVHFTNGFRQGFIPSEYAYRLSHSKIALCPKGFHSSETFRHYEALKAGCIVLSEPLPATWMYEGSPIIQLQSWRELNKTIKKLMKDVSLQEELHHQALSWWETKLAPKAVANYMLEVIENG